MLLRNGTAIGFIGVLYTIFFMIAAYKLIQLSYFRYSYKLSVFSLRWMFLGCIVFAGFLRTISVSALAGLIVSGGQLGLERALQITFYNRAAHILLTSADFAVFSVYMFLCAIYLENLYLIRAHLFSRIILRRSFLGIFLMFNTILIIIEITLFTVLMWLNDVQSADLIRSIVTSILNLIAICNFILPILVLLASGFIQYCVLAGFPIKSAKARKQDMLWKRIMMLWAITRLAWGSFQLLAGQDAAPALGQTSDSAESNPVYAIIIILVFIGLELLPMSALLLPSCRGLLRYSDPLDRLAKSQAKDAAEQALRRAVAMGNLAEELRGEPQGPEQMSMGRHASIAANASTIGSAGARPGNAGQTTPSRRHARRASEGARALRADSSSSSASSDSSASSVWSGRGRAADAGRVSLSNNTGSGAEHARATAPRLSSGPHSSAFHAVELANMSPIPVPRVHGPGAALPRLTLEGSPPNLGSSPPGVVSARGAPSLSAHSLHSPAPHAGVTPVVHSQHSAHTGVIPPVQAGWKMVAAADMDSDSDL